LKEVTPKGVDCYFDNVGGEISNVAMERMNQYGRISVCGAISGYNSSGDVKEQEVDQRGKDEIQGDYDNMFKAFVDMLKGGNVGKAVVKV
jgi:prostaglandin reductase 1